jgi:hypothetical protein
MLASCKTPVIDTWTPYYKQMSVYGKLEILIQKYPTAGPFLQLDSATITSSTYEILCKYLVGLCDIQEFARKSVAECKSCIITSKNEGIEFTSFRCNPNMNLVICIRYAPPPSLCTYQSLISPRGLGKRWGFHNFILKIFTPLR